MSKAPLLFVVVAFALLVAGANQAAGRVTAGASAPQPQFVPCDPDPGAPGAVCGTVSVPLDRAHPAAGSIPIYFEFYPHSDSSQSSLGTIVPLLGGPGISNTRSISRPYLLGFFGPLLDRRDLLLIDPRGIGKSAAIDCPALQHGLGDFLAAVRACGAQLGAASDRYGTGDVADDIDAVRAALGIDKIDIWGVSYAAVGVRAYAYRHADHLRSAILDSPLRSGDDAFWRAITRFEATVIATVCKRSPSCAGANPDPAETLAWLTRELRKHPFDGVGYNADGVAHTLHVQESTLFNLVGNNDFLPAPVLLNYSELIAAATALRHGDRTPLLRLVAENPLSHDAGDPAGFSSTGASWAVDCSDATVPWDKNAPEAVRRAQFEAAVAALPANSFAPFSVAAALAGGSAGGPAPGLWDGCVPWPAPTRPYPPYPTPNQPFSNTPALILSGDLDLVALSDSKALASLFPQGHFVEVANAGHGTGFFSPCAQAIEFHFIATLQTGDTSCAASLTTPFHDGIFDPSTSFVPYAGVDRFPTEASGALPAAVDPAGVNQTRPSERRVVTVAWGAVRDALYRAMRMSGTSGRGLRGGSYTVTTTPTTTTIDYQGVHFSNDVSVSGHATQDLATNVIDAQVTVQQVEDQSGDQQGHADNLQGTLSFHGVFFTPSQPNGQVRGVIDGRQVALLVSMN